MKLSHYDRTMIHGLELMSRTPLIAEPENHKMMVRILEIAAERSSAYPELQPLVREVKRISDNLGPHVSIEYPLKLAMNEFDRMCMALHWDAAKGAR
ncbi:hypothetical protein [Paracoccus methylarcula]|uniref:Uncharacterized protein n=1 Tax=Paracoccus methylarcula TaxID=72022 RepID=A0A422QYR9_9RHOB|nr:hypothetical protein [Paracoccus methylarcula]RNF35069.1 hypothetical protein A7A09_008895 [Paracoccus methylarcula]